MITREIFKDWRLYVFGGLFLFNFVYVLAFMAPNKFPTGSIINIRKGSGLSEVAHELERQNVVRSAFWFRVAVITMGAEKGVQAGDYYLKEKQNGTTLAWRMVSGDHGINTVKITIPEGFTNKEIAGLFDERFTNFEKEVFLALAEQGYMFPDTYFLRVNITAGEAMELFLDNFTRKVASLSDEIDQNKHSLEEIITMSSIIEAEVQTQEDKEMISGILWERLRIGMPLQVDPAPETYEVQGLPKKPINNPGLISIKAALNPKDSPYLYFLSGKDGKTYYAKTLEEHIQNIRKYR